MLFDSPTGAINSLYLNIQGDADFDQELIRLYSSGTVTSALDQQKVRLHTDGYRVTLSSTFAVNLTTYASNVKFFNCIGLTLDPSPAPGAYCVMANTVSAGNEGALELHWIAQLDLGTTLAAPVTGASTTGLARFAV